MIGTILLLAHLALNTNILVFTVYQYGTLCWWYNKNLHTFGPGYYYTLILQRYQYCLYTLMRTS